jgi:hypothetical protein
MARPQLNAIGQTLFTHSNAGQSARDLHCIIFGVKTWV